MNNITFKTKNFWIWPGPHKPGDNGEQLLPNGYLHFVVFSIDGFPDLTINRELSQVDIQQRNQMLADGQQKFVDSLYKLCLSGNTVTGHIGLSWRYILDSEAPFDQKLRLYFIVRTFSLEEEDTQIQHIAELVPYIFPTDHGFYHPPRLVENKSELDMVLVGDKYKYIAEVRKKEAQFKPLTPMPELKSIYVPFLFSPQLNTMITVCETLVKQKNTGLVLDINLVPTQLSDYEMDILKKAVVNYDKLKRDQKIQIPLELDSAGTAGLVEVPADPIVQLAFETFRSSLNAYATGSLFLLSCRALSNNKAAAEAVLVTMARNASREYNYEMLDMEQKEEFVPATIAFQHCNISSRTRQNTIWDQPDAPTPFRRLHRLAGSAEASSFFRIPIPTDEGVPGFRTMNSRLEKAARPVGSDEVSQKKISIGRIMLRGTALDEIVSIPIEQLCKHALIVGVPGSGKTTCVFNILSQLWTQYRIPFLILELAKTEYRRLITLPDMQDLLVFSLGNQQVSPFIFNPMVVLPGITLERHFSGLEECFRGALRGLDGPAPFILREALEQAYREKGWSMNDRGEKHSLQDMPTIQDVKVALERIIPQKGYKGEIESNIKAALTLRLEYFANRRMSIGQMLNNHGSISPKDLFERPVVLELDALNEETKALMAMFILNLLREYSSMRQGGSPNQPLRHLVVLEEAHNLLGHVPWAEASEGNPKVQAVKYFIRMLSEMRALGEGILISDQLPSALATDVTKNTNIKIMHRLTSEDDRKILGSTMALNSEQFVRTVTLNPGESFLFREGWERPFHVLENDIKVPDIPISDADLAVHMDKHWDASQIIIEQDPVLEMMTEKYSMERYRKAKLLAQTDEYKIRANRLQDKWQTMERSVHPEGGDSAVFKILPHRLIREKQCVCAGLLDSIAEHESGKRLANASENNMDELLAIAICMFQSTYRTTLHRSAGVSCQCDAAIKSTKICQFIIARKQVAT